MPNIHPVLQRSLCAVAIGLWVIPWPYFSSLLSAPAIELISYSQLETTAAPAIKQAAYAQGVDIDRFLLGSIVLLCAAGLVVHIIRVNRHLAFCKSLIETANPDLKLQGRYGGNILLSEKLESAILVGVFRPSIILPKNVKNTEELNFMLDHELNHRRHYDHWKVACLALLESLFFWNPLLRALVNMQRNLIEARCDAQVARGAAEAYRAMLGRVALTEKGFNQSCSMAMGSIIWRLKVMESSMNAKLLNLKNSLFSILMLALLGLTIPSLLGSSIVAASSSKSEGAALELYVETKRVGAEQVHTSSTKTELWIHYDKEIKMAFGNDFELRLKLIKQKDNAVFLATTLLDLTLEEQVISEPQLMVELGKTATIEVGDENWRYMAVFKVDEAPVPEGQGVSNQELGFNFMKD
ncbi:M56 family metallopeptidase [uncultured Pseudoteredinibacter sp.]|uniref:M56 family metallopeptidase n=1 Tax=uncultured Pseudoteredinibacter sp. TaxID=1641701 RepID=UPI00261CDA5F|nr:M56 family metallopeptidase [uncultured Pseudoteredinibacter sp.]